jgi:carbon-monoxide dehydrogenase small subunit
MEIKFSLNGNDVIVDVPPMKRLIDVLRDDFGLSGTKEGCGEGECGACSILLNGLPVTSCIMNAVHVIDKKVETVEYLAETELGKLLIDCFDEVNAVQCGFCFPGFVVAAYHYIKEKAEADEQEIKHALSGNICRCTGYVKVIDAVMLTCQRVKERGMR